MRDSYSLSDIRQMLRLPAAVTHSVLSCPTNRDIFIKMLVEATLVSMTDEEQVYLLVMVTHDDSITVFIYVHVDLFAGAAPSAASAAQ